MTIIIRIKSALVADNAGVVDDHLQIVQKVYRGDGCIWGLAGPQPLREMLAELMTVDKLVAIMRLYPKNFKQASILVIDETGGYQIGFVDDELFVDVIPEFFQVGCYRTEWLRYRAGLEPVVADAVTFCQKINDLNGCSAARVEPRYL